MYGGDSNEELLKLFRFTVYRLHPVVAYQRWEIIWLVKHGGVSPHLTASDLSSQVLLSSQMNCVLTPLDPAARFPLFSTLEERETWKLKSTECLVSLYGLRCVNKASVNEKKACMFDANAGALRNLNALSGKIRGSQYPITWLKLGCFAWILFFRGHYYRRDPCD